MLNEMTIISHNAEETEKLGRLIGSIVQEGDVLLLNGPLGAGKTCLTQGIAHGLGIDAVTQSPTFTLIREYEGRLPLYHMDLYRLNFSEISDLGIEEYLYGYGVCVIEWAERGDAMMPEEAIVFDISYLDENERKIVISGDSARAVDFVEELEDKRGKN